MPSQTIEGIACIFPSGNVNGTPAPNATLICFAYTTANTSIKGCTWTKCKFLHLDVGALPAGTVLMHFAGLRMAIRGPLATAYHFTAEGDHVSM
jgi:hypothetical protein